MRGDARLGQRVTDKLARALKLHSLGEFESRSDALRLGGGGGEIIVERLQRIEAGDRKREYDFVALSSSAALS
jgi:hypothetical protein